MKYLSNLSTTTATTLISSVSSEYLSNPNTTIKSALSGETPVREITDFDKIEFALYSLVFVIGVIGNFLVILTFIRWGEKSALKHLFILNLAITDVITLLFALPVTIMGTFISWPFGKVTCKYIYPITDVVIGTSVFTMVCISLERYRAIEYPLAAKPTKFVCKLILIGVWIVSYVAVGLPLSFYLQLGRGFWVERACTLAWPSTEVGKIYYVQRTLILYIIPTIIILGVYLRVNDTLQKNLRFIEGTLRGQTRRNRIREQRRLIRMFLVIFIAFAICFLPVHVLSLVLVFYTKIGTWKGFGHVVIACMLFTFANSACNPVILATMSGDFRKRFKSFLCCCVRPNNNEEKGHWRQCRTLSEPKKDSLVSIVLGRLSELLDSASDTDVQASCNNNNQHKIETYKENNETRSVNFAVEADVIMIPNGREEAQRVKIADAQCEQWETKDW